MDISLYQKIHWNSINFGNWQFHLHKITHFILFYTCSITYVALKFTIWGVTNYSHRRYFKTLNLVTVCIMLSLHCNYWTVHTYTHRTVLFHNTIVPQQYYIMWNKLNKIAKVRIWLDSFQGNIMFTKTAHYLQ